jgi:uncharacterized protein YkwD
MLVNKFLKSNKIKSQLLNISIFACILVIISLLYFVLQTNNSKAQVKENFYNEDQIILAINKERVKSGLKTLDTNSKLNFSAKAKAQHMKDKNYFSHVYSTDGTKWSDFIQKEDYDYEVAGENLANGFYDVDSMVEAWMNSPSHKENILNEKVDETGVGIVHGELNGKSTIFVVEHFGKKQK